MSTVGEYTLEGWISKYRTELNTVSRFIKQWAISDGQTCCLFSDETVLSKYHNELEALILQETMTDREREYYAYNPRLFAYDLYGAPEMWYMILYANEMHCAMQFNVQRVRFYSKDVTTVMNQIRLTEASRLDDNAQEISDIIVNNKIVNADVNISVV